MNVADRTFASPPADRRAGRWIPARFPSPRPRGERAGGDGVRARGPVRAQCLHPHRQGRQDHAGHAAGRDGPGRLHLVAHDPRRGARRGLRPGGADACAGQRQTLRQSCFWHPGHRQFQLRSRVLAAAAQGGRRGARHAGAGGSATVAGRAGKLHDGERAGDPRDQRPQAFLWRPGGSGEQSDAAEGRPAQGPEGLHADRQAAETPRYAGQDQRQGRVRHRRDAARHEVRDPGAMSRVRRQGRPCRRQGGQGRSRRAAGCRARRPGRGRRRSHVGGEEGSRCPRHHLERGSEREGQLEGHLAGSARGERKGRARRKGQG